MGGGSVTSVVIIVVVLAISAPRHSPPFPAPHLLCRRQGGVRASGGGSRGGGWTLGISCHCNGRRGQRHGSLFSRIPSCGRVVFVAACPHATVAIVIVIAVERVLSATSPYSPLCRSIPLRTGTWGACNCCCLPPLLRSRHDGCTCRLRLRSNPSGLCPTPTSTALLLFFSLFFSLPLLVLLFTRALSSSPGPFPPRRVGPSPARRVRLLFS